MLWVSTIIRIVIIKEMMRKALGLLYIVNLECDVAYRSFWLNWLAVWIHAMSNDVIPAVIGFIVIDANNNWVTGLGGTNWNN